MRTQEQTNLFSPSPEQGGPLFHLHGGTYHVSFKPPPASVTAIHDRILADDESWYHHAYVEDEGEVDAAE
jgi:hypothetical protein